MPMRHHEKKGDNKSIMLIEVATCTKYQILTCICSFEKKDISIYFTHDPLHQIKVSHIVQIKVYNKSVACEREKEN